MNFLLQFVFQLSTIGAISNFTGFILNPVAQKLFRVDVAGRRCCSFSFFRKRLDLTSELDGSLRKCMLFNKNCTDGSVKITLSGFEYLGVAVCSEYCCGAKIVS